MTGDSENRGGLRWSRRRAAVRAVAVLIIILIPLFAIHVTDQVEWDFADFAVYGAIVVGAAVLFELAVRKTTDTAYRSAVGVALGAAFVLIGVNGAVGVIGDAQNDANLMFGGVLAAAITGAIITRARPGGMVRVMYATALAQASVAVIALIAGSGSSGPIWPLDILISTVIFASLWLFSALLFRKAAQNQKSAF